MIELALAHGPSSFSARSSRKIEHLSYLIGKVLRGGAAVNAWKPHDRQQIGVVAPTQSGHNNGMKKMDRLRQVQIQMGERRVVALGGEETGLPWRRRGIQPK